MYEALMSILLDNMETKFEDDPWNLSFIHEVKSKLEGLARDPSCETYTNFIDLKEFKTFYHMFLDYKLMLS